VSPTLPLALYAVATRLVEPLAPRLLHARAAQGKEEPSRIGERLGRSSASRPAGDLVWLHGVSVGESLSLLPLIAALRTRRPELAILVTSSTVTSAALLAKRLPHGVLHQYAPLDTPRATRRFLDHWRPAAALFVESELWPNLILAAQARGIRLALLSARITQASAAGWGRAPASARKLLAAFDLILPQDDASAERLRRLGAQTQGELNLKLAGAPPPVDRAVVEHLRDAAGGRAIILAASTHPGEEPLIAEAVRAAAPDALLVIAPRHPDRGQTIAAELLGQGFAVARRAAGEPATATTGIYVADTLGELGALIAAADVVVMGGSFVNGVGGHNPLEPARLGAAIVTGPEVFNAAQTYASMFAAGAAIEAGDAEALTRHLRGLLAYPAIARRLREAALAYAGRQSAQLDEAMALLTPLLPA